ncbi:hypothetical protein [Bacillus pumilus]|uniref:hypothetical protein n=1 Tax=Bacillus pumilus TaxID=1408 RepID=UPI001C216820|nr:hypothetical protein [Bacillus pumilus]MBU8607797.1 hypothetical protein [Bacillus pumilus]
MEAYEMTLAEFATFHKSRFVRYPNKINISGVLSLDGKTVYPIPAGCQRRGKLIRDVDSVLKQIHNNIVKQRHTLYLNGLLPTALPWEKSIKKIDINVLKDYPELTSK